MIRGRLSRQIHATIVAALVLTVVLTALAFAVLHDGDRPSGHAIALAQRAVALTLPEASAPRAEQNAALQRLARELDVDIVLFDAEDRVIAHTGEEQPGPRPEGEERWWRHAERDAQRAFGATITLPDGRSLWVRLPLPDTDPFLALPLVLGAVALAIGAASYPLARRLTGRLERLRTSVERIGEGDLTTRAPVEGRDEIADLAESFNEAAERIERLVEAHRSLLANASHELRTPLSRIRMGLEMARPPGNERRLDALQADVTELDRLIDEILTMSRLDAGATTTSESGIDLLGLVAEECAAVESDVAVIGDAPAPLVTGDRELLKRVVRNLVANALRHGELPVTVEVAAEGGSATLTVRDEGPGIHSAERDRVFERFYRGGGKQNVEGYGLGLPLVRQIAIAHGGSVEIASGRESAVVVALPCE